jgi:NADPH:quinone reductase-like Zn-dependent oxidoreductase
MISAIERWSIKPVIDRQFDFPDLAAALRHQESGAHFGHIVASV